MQAQHTVSFSLRFSEFHVVPQFADLRVPLGNLSVERSHFRGIQDVGAGQRLHGVFSVPDLPVQNLHESVNSSQGTALGIEVQLARPGDLRLALQCDCSFRGFTDVRPVLHVVRLVTDDEILVHPVDNPPFFVYVRRALKGTFSDSKEFPGGTQRADALVEGRVEHTPRSVVRTDVVLQQHVPDQGLKVEYDGDFLLVHDPEDLRVACTQQPALLLLQAGEVRDCARLQENILGNLLGDVEDLAGLHDVADPHVVSAPEQEIRIREGLNEVAIELVFRRLLQRESHRREGRAHILHVLFVELSILEIQPVVVPLFLPEVIDTLGATPHLAQRHLHELRHVDVMTVSVLVTRQQHTFLRAGALDSASTSLAVG